MEKKQKNLTRQNLSYGTRAQLTIFIERKKRCNKTRLYVIDVMVLQKNGNCQANEEILVRSSPYLTLSLAKNSLRNYSTMYRGKRDGAI